VTGPHQQQVQKAARKKRGSVKTLASDGLQPLVSPAERHTGIKRSSESLERRRKRVQRLTPRQKEALTWVGSDWESPQQIVDRTGERTMVVRNHLRVLAHKGLIERCHESGRVRRLDSPPDPEAA